MTYGIIGLAGVLGALLRFFVGRWFEAGGTFPWGTLIANMTGCLMLGWLLTSLRFWISPHPWIKAGLGSGFIGAYTTFSTFSVETVRLVTEHHMWGTAVLYVLVSIWGGLVFVWIGHTTACRMFSPERKRGDSV